MLKAIFQAVILGKSIHNTSLKELPKNDHVKNMYYASITYMISDHAQFHLIFNFIFYQDEHLECC